MAHETQEEIENIINLYKELGTYAAVSRKLGISSSIISRIVSEQANLGIPYQLKSKGGPAIPQEMVAPLSKKQFYDRLMEFVKEELG